MIESGIIRKALSSQLAEVELIATAQCGSCGGCGLGKNTSNSPRIVIAENQTGAKINDRVEVELPARYYYLALFYLIVLPLLVLLGAMLVFQVLKIDQVLNLIASLGLFFCSYYLAAKYERKVKQEQLYRIVPG